QIEKISDGEVIKGKSQCTNKSAATVASLNLDLTGTSLYKTIFYVDSPRIGIRILNVRFDLFRIKKAQGPQFTDTPNDVGFVIFLARSGTEFPEDHMVIGLVVPNHRYMVKESLLSFYNTDFEVYRIVLGGHFDRIDAGKHIPI